ncbi:MAG: DUF4392 domain-containing protein [Pirellulales bacterium]
MLTARQAGERATRAGETEPFCSLRSKAMRFAGRFENSNLCGNRIPDSRSHLARPKDLGHNRAFIGQRRPRASPASLKSNPNFAGSMASSAAPGWVLELGTYMAQDPGGRGLVGFSSALAPAANLELLSSAQSLARDGTAVGIVTGFPILTAGGAAETDGPPGALYLARACRALGMRVDWVCDPLIRAAIELGLRASSLDCEILDLAHPAGDRSAWRAAMDRCLARGWSHLVAIERPGPAHTLDTFLAQQRAGPPPVSSFLAEIPIELQGTCRNMRGEALEDFAAPLWRLFEDVQRRRLPICTLGLIDGGNEIGAGSLPWELIAARVPQGGRIACRTPCDHTLIAGVTDWAAYALALAMLGVAGQLERAAAWTCGQQAELLETLVDEGGLVDGVSGDHAVRVDGLPPDVYLGCLGNMRVACGLPP